MLGSVIKPSLHHRRPRHHLLRGASGDVVFNRVPGAVAISNRATHEPAAGGRGVKS